MVIISRKQLVSSVTRECYGDMATCHFAEEEHGNRRCIGKRLVEMRSELQHEVGVELARTQ